MLSWDSFPINTISSVPTVFRRDSLCLPKVFPQLSTMGNKYPEVETKAKASYKITRYLTLVSPKETSTIIKPHLWQKEPALMTSLIFWIWAKFLQISAIHKSPNQNSPTLREERTGLEILGHGGPLSPGASSGSELSHPFPDRDSQERRPCILPSDSITTPPWSWLIQMLPY